MPTPFPGVDPYIEAQDLWQEPLLLQLARRREVDHADLQRYSGCDFHHCLLWAAEELLNQNLPQGYRADTGARMQLTEVFGEPSGRVLPYLIDPWGRKPGRPTKSSGTGSKSSGSLVPARVPLPGRYVEVVDRWIEIWCGSQKNPIALIEILTPRFKARTGLGDYLARRGVRLRQKVHLVEIDLLLGGERLPMQDPLPPGDFHAVVSRRDERPLSDVYAWTIRQPLPTLPIPLSRPDPDVMLDLSTVFAMAYDRGRFAELVDYTVPPSTVEKSDDRAWAERTAKAARR